MIGEYHQIYCCSLSNTAAAALDYELLAGCVTQTWLVSCVQHVINNYILVTDSVHTYNTYDDQYYSNSSKHYLHKCPTQRRKQGGQADHPTTREKEKKREPTLAHRGQTDP